MTAYTNAEALSLQLGVDLLTDGGRRLAADWAAAAVTQWIDDYKGQSWQTAAVVGERHQAPYPTGAWADGGLLTLRTKPVVSIQQVRRRSFLVNAAPTVLLPANWELLDATRGLLLVKVQWDALLLVDYTVAATPPAHIALAATLLAARFLQPLLAPGSQGLDSLSVGGGELAVRFSNYRQSDGLPPEVLALLGPRLPVLA